MLARFFIDRPVFAIVISLVIVFAGLAAGFTLPIAQYPEITPPTVEVSCSYPGANARVVQETIAAPIEQEVNGVEKMLYMSSQCTNDGGYRLSVTFKLGTNLDMAQVLVQNRVALALPKLPDVVKTTGVSTKKKSPSILLVVNLFSETDESTGRPMFNQLFLSNYATIQMRDELLRIDGVGDVSFLGQQDYSMRVWLDPEKMASRNLTANDVVNALREQNVQVAAGTVGQPPVPNGLDFQYTLTTLGRLTEPTEFGQIIVKTGSTGQPTRLDEIGRLELGAKNQDTACSLDGRPSVGMAIYQLPGSNALETAKKIRAKVADLETRFDKGMRSAIVYDTTPFIEESVNEVFKALRDAVILVAIVVLLFLQDWKSMTLPMIDVPVSLIGTLAVMWLMGFTLNNLTLFGLVLAIGIVVDDAIVVLEGIERWLERGQDARTATISAMNELTGPIITITLVLSSVFLPSAMLSGISGQFYSQFALTISASMIISAVNALTMTPSRAVQIFKNRRHGHDDREAFPWWGYMTMLGWWGASLLEPVIGLKGEGAAAWALWLALFVPGAILGWFITKPMNRFLAGVFKIFNRGFDAITRVYGSIVASMLRISSLVMLVYVGLLGLTYFGITRTPIGFIPSQDKGYLVVNMQLPDSASLERSVAVVKKVEKIAQETEGVAHTVGIAGQSIVLNAVGSNFCSMFIILDEFHHRRGHSLSANAIAGLLQKRFFTEVLDAQIAVFGAPPVDGLGSAGGFKLMVQDRSDQGLGALQERADEVAAGATKQPGIAYTFNSFRSDTPQLYIDIDRTKCKALGVPLSDAFQTLQVFLGGYYVNDFNQFGRTWQVNLQADSPFRLRADDVRNLKVRNVQGKMVPLGTISRIDDVGGPIMITRYNMFPAAPLNGASLPGVSTGDMIASMKRVTDAELTAGMTSEWTELTYLQLQEGSAALYAFIGAIILVFLVLAAQYESWSMPMSVLLVVPMCLLSAVFGLWMTHLDINIFVQVGFIVLVGLAAKNAILIVETARERRHAGKSVHEAALEAAKERLRPIVMTSLAFILGVAPLVFSHGAGAEMRQTLGIAVFSGMCGVTIFGILLTPVFYKIIDRFGKQPAAKQEPSVNARPNAGTEPAPSH
ncbi:efflux RND transporter permease subunit [Schlesneria paludicola]|uniref:efflux RND transporter permease subunit n=1 Tax=Schlesneria paludicola TaxID=360056 RepID=UPI000299EEAA|nr:multidrug efflux RND transporter permease subunit [Schlesneria paludicola]